MKWSDVTAPPSVRMLRQFAGLCLVFLAGIAAVRFWRGDRGALTIGMAAAGAALGVAGLMWPAAVRWIYTGWMIAAFPIGWVVSHAVLGGMFFLIFTPLALVFRLMGRDELQLRRRPRESYWSVKPGAGSAREYFRQS